MDNWSCRKFKSQALIRELSHLKDNSVQFIAIYWSFTIFLGNWKFIYVTTRATRIKYIYHNFSLLRNSKKNKFAKEKRVKQVGRLLSIEMRYFASFILWTAFVRCANICKQIYLLICFMWWLTLNPASVN